MWKYNFCKDTIFLLNTKYKKKIIINKIMLIFIFAKIQFFYNKS